MKLTSNQRNIAVVFACAALSALPAIAWLQLTGTSDDKLLWILTVGGRISFILLLLAFVARPLQSLLRNGTTLWLLRNRRLIGVAFATVHLVHLGFIGMRFAVIPGFAPPIAELWPGIVVYLFIVFMLITSFDAPARAIGRKPWQWLHRIGIWLIFTTFAMSAILDTLSDEPEPIHFMKATLVVVAFGIRVVAFLKSFRKAASGSRVVSPP